MSSEATMPMSSSEVVQQYHQAMVAPGCGLSGVAADHDTFSPENSSCSPGGQLNPKGCISKPIRRRSRASRRTPTTLLNADATNFRALVQQFTGCSTPPSLPGGTRRGPINLSFGQGMSSDQEHVVSTTATSMMASFGLNNYNQVARPRLCQPQPQPQPQPHHQLLQQQHCQLQEGPLVLYQEHECMFTAPNNDNDANTRAFFTTFNDSYFN